MLDPDSPERVGFRGEPDGLRERVSIPRLVGRGDCLRHPAGVPEALPRVV
jgi:hypothetical protein